jgi:ADP-heptose:LPS heptosyltransferase
MRHDGIVRFVSRILKVFLSLRENNSKIISTHKKIIIICRHFSLGELLACVPVFRALKEKYPNSELTVITKNDTIDAVAGNPFINSVVGISRKDFLNPIKLAKFLLTLRKNYNLALMPVIENVSALSCLITRLSNADRRVGAKSLNGNTNYFQFCFDSRIDLDWRRHHDYHITERCLEIVRPFGINTNDLKSIVTYGKKETVYAKEYISKIKLNKNELLIGLNLGANNPENRWSVYSFVSLLELLERKYKAKFYLTGNKRDENLVELLVSKLSFKVNLFINRSVPEVAAIVSVSDLFITNDTGIMQVAGTTDTPLIAIFGASNPYSRLPVGSKKFFIRKSDLIDDVQVVDVFNLACEVINPHQR